MHAGNKPTLENTEYLPPIFLLWFKVWIESLVEIFFKGLSLFSVITIQFSDNLLMGDINFDQTIDVLDVILCVNIALGTGTPSQDQILVADLNYDGSVNVLDVVSLVQLIIGGNEPTTDELCGGDISGDGIINVLDVVALVQIIID